MPERLALPTLPASSPEKPAPTSPPPRETVGAGRYRLLEALGGSGRAFLAEAPGGKRVVVKLAPPASPDEAELARLEMAALAALGHDHVEKILDCGVEPDGVAWFAAEHIAGETLERATRALRRERPVLGGLVPTFPILLRVVAQLCRALQHVHDRGLVHGDVSPRNVMVCTSAGRWALPGSEGLRAVLVDFGFATREGAPVAALPPVVDGAVRGTWGFIAPEVLLGTPPSRASDLWSLGATIHAVVTGRPPFEGKGPEEILAAARAGIPRGLAERNPRLPLALDPLLRGLLHADPSRRFPDANEAIRELNAYTGEGLPEEEAPAAAAEGRSRPRFVGRDRILTDLVERAGALGGPRPTREPWVLLCGGTGAGKTRLLEELRVRLEVGGTPVLAAGATEGDPRPFGALGDLLRGAVARFGAEDAIRARHPAAFAALEGRSEPDAAAAPPPAPEGENHDAIRRAEEFVATLLDAIGDRRVVLLVDDSQHLDPTDRALLAHIARATYVERGLDAPDTASSPSARGRLLLVATVRGDPAQPPEPFARELTRPAGLGAFVGLPPLDPESAADLLRWCLGGADLPAPVLARPDLRAAARPRSLLAAARSLLADGVLRREEGRWVADREALARWKAPAEDDAVLERELAGLPPEARQALSALAAFRRPVPAGVLVALVPGEKPGLLGALRELEIRGLVRRTAGPSVTGGPGIVLAHPQDRQEFLRGLRPEARARLHGRAAEALAAAAGKADEAWVGELSDLILEAGDAEKTVAAALRAAAASRAAGRPAEARETLRRALALASPHDTGRPDVQKELFELELLLGEFEAASARAPEIPRVATEPAEATRARLRLARLAAAQGRWAEVEAEVKAGLRTAEDAPPVLMAALLERRAYAALRSGRPGEAERALAEATAAHRGAKGPEAEEVRDSIALIQAGLWRRDRDLDRAEKALREVAESSRARGDSVREGHAVRNLAVVLRAKGDLPGAIAAAQSGLEAARRVGDVVASARILTTLGNLATDLGEFRRARGYQLEALGILTRLGIESERAMVLANLGRISEEMGRLGDGSRHMEEARAVAEMAGARETAAIVALNHLGVLIRMADQGGSRDSAERLFKEIGTRKDSPLLQALLHERVAGRFALRKRVDESLAESRTAAEALRGAGDPREATRVLCEAALLLARVGRGKEARALLEEAGTPTGWLAEIPALLARSATLAADGDAAGAVSAAAEAAARLPADAAGDLAADVSYWRGRAAEQAGEIPAAVAAYSDSLRLHEDIARRLPDGLGDAYLADWRRADVPERLRGIRGKQREAEGGAAGGLTVEDIARVSALTADLSRVLDLPQLLDRILAEAVDLTGAERGFVILVEGGRLEIRAALNMDGEKLPDALKRISQSVAKQVVREGDTVLASNAEGDPRFQSFVSVRQLRLRSILGAPFRSGGRAIGCLYVDHRFREDAFDARAAALAEAFAGQVGVAIENARLFAEREKALRAAEDLREERDRLLTLRTAELRAVSSAVPRAGNGPASFEGLVGGSPAMREAYRLIEKFAESDATVLILGESGTGKELAARALHRRSSRRGGRLVSENFAALHGPLALAELFGHVKGAFTGAHADREGLFAMADGGTLFLDEVGDLDPEVQVALLRVIEEGQFRPVGGVEVRPVDVRIVCATNKDLGLLVRQGGFREDLFYRLNVLTLRLPPLRKRPEDIPPLVEHFRRRFEAEGVKCPKPSRETLDLLAAYPWPGNVRELENELRRAALLAKRGVLLPKHFSDRVRSPDAEVPGAPGTEELRTRGFWHLVQEYETQIITEGLRACRGNQAAAARYMKMDRITMIRKMRQYGLFRGLNRKRGRPRKSERPPA
ncbi:MAG: sigma 54-interacting transcriptional regulator [Planctomycetales bacterium]|nr:sigma 54-interacting transcriptional regulator [Planctomycetales bacterium]